MLGTITNGYQAKTKNVLVRCVYAFSARKKKKHNSVTNSGTNNVYISSSLWLLLLR